MSYDRQCGNCLEFKDKDNTKKLFDTRYAKSEKGYCEYYGYYYWADDSCSYHYKDRDTYVPSACYITTIICDVLEFEDDCSVLTNLRKFRDNVMQKDPKYLKLLLEYDVIGPKIADSIRDEYKKTQDKEMWIQFYNFYLAPTSNLIADNKYEDAITRYMEMISSLKEYFCFENIDLEQIANNYDMQNGGHGKLKFLERNN